MGITVLGPLTVDGSGRLGPRDRVVLQALVTRLGQPVSADELIDALWHDHPPASAAKNLQSCVVRLRKALGAQAIETMAEGYRLAVAGDEVDARRFESQVARARQLLALGEADRVAFLLEQALELWRGAAFMELAEWPPARREAGRLEELRLDAEELLLEAQLRRGRAPEVLSRAHEMVWSAPLRERRWELLALAQYRSGAQGEALRTIRQLRAELARELGIDPSGEVMALEQSILRQDPSLAVPHPLPIMERCPWQGLMAYDVGDAERFFGRDADVAACLGILGRRSFLALVGPSGSGKSSIMRAGVLSVLRSRGHRIVLITPGSRPMLALSALPENASPRTVLAVDQAEEVFTVCEDVEERRAFLERLADEARRRPVLVTVRGDRLTQATEHTGFSRLVEQGLHLVGALDEAGLRDAVQRPAYQAGLVIEPGLVELLVREVRDDPGALPLLSHALLETWQRREGNTLSVDGYHASGGIHGAVAQSAERLYGLLDPDQRRQLRDLMLRLVSPGTGGEAVRAQVPRRLIAKDRDDEHLIEMLVSARLVTDDLGVLEITHEALARAWPRLRGWLDDDVEGQRIRHHLSDAADAWDSLGRPDSELYRGVRLTRALDWQSRTDSALTDTERAFLSAALAASEAEERSAAERAAAQTHLIRRLRIVLGGAAALLVIALVAGSIAAVQSNRAERNAAEARHAAVSADARRVGVRAQLSDDISLSMLLAAAGARLDKSPETQVNLLAALAKRPHLVRSAPPEGDYLDVMEVSRDGRLIAASDAQNRMHLYSAASSRLLRSYDAGRPAGDGQAFIIGAFSPDSRQLALIPYTVESTEPVRLLNTNTMRPAINLAFPDSGKPVWGVDVEFSADGRHLAATMHTAPLGEDLDTPGYALVWDLRSPSSPPQRVRTGRVIQGMALSPDGQTLYTNWPLTAYDVATGEQIWRRAGVHSYPTLEINRAGSLLALEDWYTHQTLLLDPADGATVHTLRGHRAEVSDIQFSPDGSLVGSVSRDGELVVWRTATGRPVERWDTFDPWGIGFSPDNDLVYSGGGDSMLRTWDLSVQDTYLRQTTRVRDAKVFEQANLSPDGQQVAYGWLDDKGTGWVRFIDTVTGERTPATRLPENEAPGHLGTWDPQGGRYAVYTTFCDDCGQQAGIVSVLDATTGELFRGRDVVDGDGGVLSLAYVDEGRSLLAGDSDDRTLILDPVTLRLRAGPFDLDAHCCATAIANGSTAMVYEAASDGLSAHWRVIGVSTGEVLSEGELDLRPNVSVASPDGSTVAVAGSSGEIVAIDVSTGEQRRSTTSLGAEVRWLNYSDDGERLVSGAANGAVSLWDARTLDLLGTVFPPHEGTAVPTGAQFIGDSHDVAIASYDGRVYTWETDVDRAIDFACQMAGRNLTEEEWEEFLPAQPFQSVCPDE